MSTHSSSVHPDDPPVQPAIYRDAQTPGKKDDEEDQPDVAELHVDVVCGEGMRRPRPCTTDYGEHHSADACQSEDSHASREDEGLVK